MHDDGAESAQDVFQKTTRRLDLFGLELRMFMRLGKRNLRPTVGTLSAFAKLLLGDRERFAAMDAKDFHDHQTKKSRRNILRGSWCR